MTIRQGSSLVMPALATSQTPLEPTPWVVRQKGSLLAHGLATWLSKALNSGSLMVRQVVERLLTIQALVYRRLGRSPEAVLLGLSIFSMPHGKHLRLAGRVPARRAPLQACLVFQVHLAYQTLQACQATTVSLACQAQQAKLASQAFPAFQVYPVRLACPACPAQLACRPCLQIGRSVGRL